MGLCRKAVDVALAKARVLRVAFALLGRPRVQGAVGVSSRRFFLDVDGDHAMWSRVVGFLWPRAS